MNLANQGVDPMQISGEVSTTQKVTDIMGLPSFNLRKDGF
jgi:hypothetical protein